MLPALPETFCFIEFFVTLLHNCVMCKGLWKEEIQRWNSRLKSSKRPNTPFQSKGLLSISKLFYVLKSSWVLYFAILESLYL